ncbi:MAG: XRE family transcriptional regulator [Pseudonocardiales bacterium]|nr:MAG: XRE family transcriptional regulator [Pseudonocardiales bacterium]
MPRPIAPTIPRWQLGEQLSRLRDAADVSQGQIADRLGCSVSKIQKIEAGEVGTVRAEVEAMLAAYRVGDERLRAELMELQRLGKQRGWWSGFGAIAPQFSTFLGLQSAAIAIRAFEPMVVYGLLQTEGYSRSIAETCTVGPTEEEVELQVRIRLEQQEQAFGKDPPQVRVLLDEAVLHREVGGRAVMADQLRHLTRLPKQVTLQVVPFRSGGYPGTLGAFTIFDFAEKMHAPVVYVEGQAGNLYLKKEVDLRRCSLAYSHIAAAALSKQESATLIAAVAGQYAGA